MLKSLSLSIAALFLLTGCVSTPLKKPIVPSNLTKACPELKPFNGNTMGELMVDATETAHIYNKCRTKHKRLAEFVDGIGE